MSRYIPNTDKQQKEMLEQSGHESIEDLFSDIPDSIRLKRKLNIGGPMTEMELVRHMEKISYRNKNIKDFTCFLGAGAYDHYIPSVIDHIISRQEFYTSYTPYQPEISQGMLQAIFEYQTMICELTGMEVSNASLYDGATALAEAAGTACSVTRKKQILVAHSVHPESREVLNTYSSFNGMEIVEIGCKNGLVDLEDLEKKISLETAAVILQYPNFFGIVDLLKEAGEFARKNKALFIVSADPVALGILKAPGSLGADIVVGDGQSLGNPLNFGGPGLGFMAAKKKLVRKIPGRIVGQTVDKSGKRGFVLTIQTREQHIRREKATSNICSNQALNALAAAVYMSVTGKQGIKRTAELCLHKSHYAYNKLIETGKFKTRFQAPFFKEFVVESKESVEKLNKQLFKDKIIGGYNIENMYPELKNCWLVAVTEKRSRDEIDRLAAKAGGLN